MNASLGPAFRNIWAMKLKSRTMARTIPATTTQTIVEMPNMTLLLWLQLVPRIHVGDSFFMTDNDDLRSLLDRRAALGARGLDVPRAVERVDDLPRSPLPDRARDLRDLSDDGRRRKRLLAAHQ